jgi:trk system potassium uptake protein TrkH
MRSGSKISLLKKLTPVQILALGFATIILTGALLLMLPISSAAGITTPFLTALFTSTSAVCVTGLVVVDTGTYWSTFGQFVIMLLIETGGLGFMSFATLIAILLGRKITLRERLVIHEAMNSFSLQGLVRLAKYALMATFAIEATGAALLAIRFIPDYGFVKGLWFGIFHAVSAYCNAGFDIVGNFQNLIPYQESVIVNVTVMALIVIGGIGFVVQSEIYNSRNFKKFTLHTKVVLVTTAILIFGGALLFFLLEYNNPGTMKPLSMKGKILSSFFASVTPRTAGFNTVDTTKMTLASKIITIIFMYIGASPGSTGGGIKTSTFAVLVMTVISVIKGRDDTEIAGKRIPKDLVYRALSIVAISIALLIVDVLVLSLTEKGAGLVEMVYEATSAFGTVGLSLGFSPKLTSIGRIIIILTMYTGRVGPLTLAFAFAQKNLKGGAIVKYPEEKVLIG